MLEECNMRAHKSIEVSNVLNSFSSRNELFQNNTSAQEITANYYIKLKTEVTVCCEKHGQRYRRYFSRCEAPVKNKNFGLAM